MGLEQRKSKLTTLSKIAAILTLTPCTFEELHILTGIHRNTLKKRINELLKSKVLIVHTYSIPSLTLDYLKKRCDLDLPQELDLFLSHYRRKYYLLNLSNPKAMNLANNYYQNKDQPKIRCKLLSSEEFGRINLAEYKSMNWEKYLLKEVNDHLSQFYTKKRIEFILKHITKSLSFLQENQIIRRVNEKDSEYKKNRRYRGKYQAITDYIYEQLRREGVKEPVIRLMDQFIPDRFKIIPVQSSRWLSQYQRYEFFKNLLSQDIMAEYRSTIVQLSFLLDKVSLPAFDHDQLYKDIVSENASYYLSKENQHRKKFGIHDILISLSKINVYQRHNILDWEGRLSYVQIWHNLKELGML